MALECFLSIQAFAPLPDGCTVVGLVSMQARQNIREVSLKLINSWRSTHPTTITAVAAGATAAAAPPAPRSLSPDIAATDGAPAGQEQPLVEDIAGIGQDKMTRKGQAHSGASAAAAGGVDAKVLLRRAQGKGVNPGSFLGLMLSTKDSTTGKPFEDDVVSGQVLRAFDVLWYAEFSESSVCACLLLCMCLNMCITSVQHSGALLCAT